MLNSSNGALLASKIRIRKRVMTDSQRSVERSLRVQQAALWTRRAHQGINRRTTGTTKVSTNDEK
jgi:hypothetical protein